MQGGRMIDLSPEKGTAWLPTRPVDVPPRVFNDTERKNIKDVCYRELLSHNSSEAFTKIKECIEFCQLLQDPENHIKVPSGQYVEKPVSIRTVADMTNAMVQDLCELPRYTAYAKVLQETEGEQEVWKGKIKTNPMLPLPTGEMATHFVGIEARIIEHTRQTCCRSRIEIEEEIRARRNSWRPPEPPPQPKGRSKHRVDDGPPPSSS